jgi:serine/threonine protein kinase
LRRSSGIQRARNGFGRGRVPRAMKDTPHYRIVEKIGEGGMGVVYKALDTRLNREVAIKVLRIDPAKKLSAAKVKEIRARFYKEAQAAARLNHPNIVSIFQVSHSGGQPYIVMEYLKGKSLLEKMEETRSQEEVVKLAMQICDALEYAHSQGVIHRDIKPDNIVITEDGRVKITDFGIARIEDAEIALTRAGVLLGSPAYCAPEQLRDFSNVDGRADLFSLGVILYQWLTGRLPFEGNAAPEVITKILTQEPLPPRSLNPEISPSLEALILRALAKEPEERIASAREFKAELERVLAIMKDSSATGLATTADLELPRPQRSFGKWLPGLAAAGVVVALLSYGAITLKGELGLLNQAVLLKGSNMARMLEVVGIEDSSPEKLSILQGYLAAMGNEPDIVFLEVTHGDRTVGKFSDQRRMLQEGDILVKGFPLRMKDGGEAMLLIGFSKAGYNQKMDKLRSTLIAGGGAAVAALGGQFFLLRRKRARR